MSLYDEWRHIYEYSNMGAAQSEGKRMARQKLVALALGFLILTFICTSVQAEPGVGEKVGKLWELNGENLTTGRIAYVDPIEEAIYEIDLKGYVTWKYLLPSEVKQPGNIRQGADIEWIKNKDNFLIVIPKGGIFEIDRQKNIVWSHRTRNVSHDADRLSNGNTIFVNTWDIEGEDQVVEITPNGKEVLNWKISDSGIECNGKRFRCNSFDGRKKSYTHINGVQKIDDERFLVSLRNLNRAVIIGPNFKILEIYKQIGGVHDPRITDGSIIAVDRKRGRGLIKRKRGSVTTAKDNELLLNYRELDLTFLRTNEKISDENILLTDSRSLIIFNVNSKKIVWKLNLDRFEDQKSGNGRYIYKASWVYK